MIDYFDLSLKESTLFELYNPKAYEDLLLALKLADERVTQRILKTNGEWTRAELIKTKAYINEQINIAYGGLFEGMQKDSVNVANVVYAATTGSVAAEVPLYAVNDLINSNRNIQGYSFKELFKISEDNHARQLRVLVSSGVAGGLTPSQMIREYNIKSDKLSKGQIRSDIFTTITDSRARGRYQAYRELEKLGVSDGYIYSATLDSGTTLYCRQHDQKVYHKSIDEISHLIHTHFNCRSQFIQIQETPSQTRPSQFGETETNNYESWYLKQDNSFHKSTLTNKKYNAFLKGKYKVKSLNDIDKITDLETVKREL